MVAALSAGQIKGDFVSSDNWKDVGADTPEHAFQSFLATLKAGDTNHIETAVYWNLTWKEDITEEDRRLMEKSKQDYLEMLQHAPNKFTAFNLAPVAKTDNSGRTRVFFRTLTSEGETPSSFEMIQEDGRWKPVVSMGWHPQAPSSFFTSPVFGPSIDLER